MARTVQDILDERTLTLVGRDRELSTLMRVADGTGALVAYVYGIAGVGKSTLLRALAARSRSAGACVVQLDGAAVEPTERGLLAALTESLGRPAATIDQAAAELGGAGQRTLLVIDSAERLVLVDDWMRRRLLPALPESVRLVLAGRNAPAPGWIADLGDLLAPVALGNLAPADSEEILRRAGVPERELSRVNRLAHGHPLSLHLAASALTSRAGLPLEQVAVPALVDELARIYLDSLEPDTRRALDAASVVRRPTRSLLAAMLDTDGDEAWRRLERLPFVEMGPDGLVLHETVREANEAALRATNPELRRRWRVGAFEQLRAEAEKAPPTELWRYTSDLLFLADNPLVREGFFPTGGALSPIEPAKPGDEAAILEIAERHAGAQGRELVSGWWGAMREEFRVARERDGTVTGFLFVCRPDRADTRLLARDPVTARWGEDLRRRPLPEGDCALFVRFALARMDGEGPGAAQAALWIDAKREYMSLRPNLKRVYVVTSRLDLLAELLAPLGFRELAGPPVELGERSFESLTLDFGPRSVDGWLARLVATELGVDAGPRLEPGELVLGDRSVALTPLEGELLAHLRARAGAPVPRAELLREVWGHKSPSDGNLIEAAVSAVRRKLGDDAGLVETVRGVGYRWREP